MKTEEIHCHEARMLAEINRICQEEKITYYLSYGSVLGAVREKGIISWDTDIDLMIRIEDIQLFLEVIDEKMSSEFSVLYRGNDSKYDGLVPVVVLAEGWHDLIHIDIFPMVGLPDNKIFQKLNPRVTSWLYKSFNFKTSHYKKSFDGFIPRLKHAIRKTILFPIPIKFIERLYNYMSYKYPAEGSKFIYSIASPYGTAEVIPNNYLGKPVYMEFESGQYPVPNKWHEYLTHIYGDYMVPKEENYLDYIGE